MTFNDRKKKTVFPTIILLLVISGFLQAQEKIIDLNFGQPPDSASDISRTLESLVKARVICETYATGGFYLMTHFGDREDMFRKENQEAIENPMINQTWRYCSVFSATAEEAGNLVEKYIPFDLDKNSFNSHLFVVDSSGRSVILEYVQEQWQKIYGDKSWQALSNKLVYTASDAKMRAKCWRYRIISEALENAKENVDLKAGMKILQDAAQKGTTWSVIYSPLSKELFFSVYQKWNTVYHLKTP